jgi:hypothetical protein
LQQWRASYQKQLTLMETLYKQPWLVILTLVCVNALLLLNFRFIVWPEMLLYPWLLHEHFELYRNIVNPYFPLLPYLLEGAFTLGGYSVAALKVVSVGVSLLSTLVLAIVAYRLTGDVKRTTLATLSYICLQVALEGNGIWFDQVVAPLLFGAAMLVYVSDKAEAVVAAGVLCGLPQQRSRRWSTPFGSF